MTCSVMHKIQNPFCKIYCVKNRLCKKTFNREVEEKKQKEKKDCVNCYFLLATSKAYYNKTDTCFWKQFRQSLRLDHGHGRTQAWQVRTNGTVSPGFLEKKRCGRQTQRKKTRL